jgi:hypothetical protein
MGRRWEDPSGLTLEDVTKEAESVIRQASMHLCACEVDLHNAGFGKWSTALLNMRNKIERAHYELYDELGLT